MDSDFTEFKFQLFLSKLYNHNFPEFPQSEQHWIKHDTSHIKTQREAQIPLIKWTVTQLSVENRDIFIFSQLYLNKTGGGRLHK